MAGELAECIIWFASWYCGFPTLKTSVFFGSYSCSTFKAKTRPPRRRARSKADNPVWMIFFMWSDYYTWFYLKKYWNAPKDLGWLQNVRIVAQNVPLAKRMKLFGKGAGEIEREDILLGKNTISSRFSWSFPPPQPLRSVSPSYLSFLIPPPCGWIIPSRSRITIYLDCFWQD